MSAMRKSICALVLLGLLSPVSGWADTLFITANELHTSGPDGMIQDGAVLIEDGVIAAVGPAASITAPDNAIRLEAAVVLPGLIDSHTLVGVSGAYNMHADQDGFEASNPSGSEYRVLDSFNPMERLVGFAQSMGVTTLHVTPRPTAPIAGSSSLFKSAGSIADDMLIETDVAMFFTLGAQPKAAFREQGGPGTRMATAALIRKQLYAAADWAAKPEDSRKPDLGMAALARVLDGSSKAVFTAHREDDIATALRIAAEFDLQAIIAYGTEAYLMRPLLLEREATIILAPPMQRASDMEKWNNTLEAGALLKAANVPFVISSGYEAYVPKTRVLLWETGIAVTNGLERNAAIRAVTIDPARLWGIDESVGSLEPGKDADLVLFDGDPFEYTSHIQHVIIDGQVVSP